MLLNPEHIALQTEDVEKLRSWFLTHRRDLPWRMDPHPYAVWVSEIMLQQTQVVVVIPYFERWMQRFPTIDALAKAPLEAVIKEWEGLGYYSRARNLHEGARYVAENHNSILPSSTDELTKIKGLGSYTIGAIQSFAFHQRQAAVDGNVLRVLARYYGLTDDISKPKTLKQIQSLAQSLLPENSPWTISEALIELGATVCAKKSKCSECPLKNSCKAYAQGTVSEIPYRSPREVTIPLFRAVALIQCQNHFLVKRGAKGHIMSDLYEFPYFEFDTPEIHKELILERLNNELKLKTRWKQVFNTEKHSFTRYRANLYPHLFTSEYMPPTSNYEWICLTQLHSVPFSAGHRRILLQLANL
jgi:A/G-specific adenine glycosylase